ncbi:hypothetical protein ABQE93_24375 [Mycolicibacterium sp. XJ662]
MDEMTDMPDQLPPNATDRRRAFALLSHCAADNSAGARYIVDEAQADKRETDLLRAVIDAGGQLIAALRTDMGTEAWGSLLDVWANQEENIDWRRAASVIICRFQAKYDLFDGHVADAAADGRNAELIITAAGCYVAAMPELVSPKGRASLAHVAAAMAGEEDAP